MKDQPGFWDWVALGLGIGASAIAILAAVGAVGAFGIRQWRRTVGRRRAQSAILDQLACTSSLAFVESKLGVPQFITHSGGCEERIYRLPGAWVTVQSVDGAVSTFSITITDPKMYYDIGPMAFGHIELRLGVDRFDKAPPSADTQLAIYTRQMTYVRHYYLGFPGGYQDYWLAYNEVGAGTITAAEGYVGYASGVYGTFGKPPDGAGITANTLTVTSKGNSDEMRDRIVHGPHVDQLRLLWTERERLYGVVASRRLPRILPSRRKKS